MDAKKMSSSAKHADKTGKTTSTTQRHTPKHVHGASASSKRAQRLSSLPTFTSSPSSKELTQEPDWPLSTTESENEERHGQAVPLVRVSTRMLVVAIFSVSVIVISAVAFFPAYWVTFAESLKAVRTSQRETVSGLALAIDSFFVRSAAATVSTFSLLQLEVPNRLPANHSTVLSAMANMLSLPVANEFIGALNLVVSIPGKEWRAIVYSSATTGKATPIVGYQNNLTMPCAWSTWHTENGSLTQLLEGVPVTVLVDTHPHQTLGDLLQDPHGIYQYLTVPWNRSLSACDGTCANAGSDTHSERTPTHDHADEQPYPRWSPFHEHSNTFFDLSIPFRVVDADGRTGIAYWETTLQTHRLLEEVLQFYREAFLEHSYFLVLDVQTHLVSLNSWNQSGRLPLHPFHASQINVPMMREVVSQYFSLDSLAADPGAGKDRSAAAHDTANHSMPSIATPPSHVDQFLFDYNFPFEGDQCQVFAHTISDPSGSTLVVLVAARQSELFAPVERTKRALIGTVLLTIVVTVVTLVMVVSKLVGRLQYLIESLEDTLVLQVDDADSDFSTDLKSTGTDNDNSVRDSTHAANRRRESFTNTTYAPFDELQQLSKSLQRLRRNVHEVKSFLPDSLIMETQDEVDTSSTMAQTQSSLMSTPTGTTTSQGDSRDRSRLRHRAKLNMTVFNEKVNVFHRRYCTCLWACCYYTNSVDDAALEEFFAAGYAASMEFDGCLEFFRPDYIVISFGAQSHMPTHSAQACLCALSFRSRLSEANRSKLIFLLDSREFLIGTCGKPNGRKRRVVCDVENFMQILQFMMAQGVHTVTATQRAVANLPEYLSVPFEILNMSPRDSMLLFELRGPVPIDPATGLTDLKEKAKMERTARAFRTAFHEMRSGLYARAANVYSKMAASDPLAARLLAYCAEMVEQRNRTPFMSYGPNTRFHWITRFVTSPFIRPVIFQYLDSVTASAAANPVLLPPSSPRSMTSSDVDGKLGPPSVAATRAAGPVGEKDGITQSSSSQYLVGSTSPHHRPVISTTRGTPVVPPSRRTRETTSDGSVGRIVSVEETTAQGTSFSGSQWPDGRQPSSGGAQTELSVPVVPGESVTTPGEQFLTGFNERPPSELVDSSGTKWMLSKDPLGYTAVGAWFSTFSSAGVPARLEWMPRRRSKLDGESLIAQLDALVELQHSNLLQCNGYHVSNSSIVLVLEDAQGGSLHDLLATFGPLDYLTVRRYTLDVLLGLVYLHGIDMIHGSLNLRSVLIGSDGVCKLGEVGQYAIVDRLSGSAPTDLARACAKENVIHMAPEVAAGGPRTRCSDVYALGVLVLELVVGFVPMRWHDGAGVANAEDVSSAMEDLNTLTEYIAKGEIVVSIPEDVPLSVCVFVRACCHRDPDRRATAQSLFSFPLVL